MLQDGSDRGGFLSEASQLEYCQSESEMIINVCQFFQSYVCAYLGLHERGSELALSRGDDMLKNTPGMVLTMIDPFVRSMSLFGMARQCQGSKKRRYMVQARKARKFVSSWAKKGNPNVVHQLKLLKAENLATVRGRKKSFRGKVLQLYKESIALASQEGFVHDSALACERCAEYLLTLDDQEEAHRYWEDSIRRYTDWGARGKVKALRSKLASNLDVKGDIAGRRSQMDS